MLIMYEHDNIIFDAFYDHLYDHYYAL